VRVVEQIAVDAGLARVHLDRVVAAVRKPGQGDFVAIAEEFRRIAGAVRKVDLAAGALEAVTGEFESGELRLEFFEAIAAD
jgi:hypothetical protein